MAAICCTTKPVVLLSSNTKQLLKNGSSKKQIVSSHVRKRLAAAGLFEGLCLVGAQFRRYIPPAPDPYKTNRLCYPLPLSITAPMVPNVAFEYSYCMRQSWRAQILGVFLEAACWCYRMNSPPKVSSVVTDRTGSGHSNYRVEQYVRRIHDDSNNIDQNSRIVGFQ